MKSSKNLIIILLSILVIILGGFIFYDKVLKKSPSENNNVQNPSNEYNNQDVDNSKDNKQDTEDNDNQKSIKINNSKDYIYDATYAKNVSASSYTTQFGTYYSKDLIVPYININSDDAEEANNELQQTFGIMIEMYNAGVEDQQTYAENNYDYYLGKDYVSLIFSFGLGGTDVIVPSYFTYNFDLNDGDFLDLDDITSKLKIKDFKTKAEQAIMTSLLETLQDFDESNYPEGTNFNSYYKETIDDFELNLENEAIKFFVDKNGKLNFIVRLSVPIGQGSSTKILTIE